MMIEIKKYNEIGGLLVGTDTIKLLGQIFYWDTELEGICNYGGFLHEGGGDGVLNMTQGRIQFVAKMGMLEGTSAMAMEQPKKHQSVI